MRWLFLCLSLFAGIGAAEALARLLEHPPVLRAFESDPDFGVRLRPKSTTQFFGPNAKTTSVVTNAQGFRDLTWSNSGATLVIGDSQVMGYGVEVDKSFAHRLEADGLSIQAAGVPSYGPPEYAELNRRLSSSGDISQVVVVLNMANDWFEAHPNYERSESFSGYLVRRGQRFHSSFWAKHSSLYRAMRQLLNARPSLGRNAHAPFVPKWKRFLSEGVSAERKADVQKIFTELKGASEDAKSLGIHFSVMILPTDIHVLAEPHDKYGPTLLGPIELERWIAGSNRVVDETVSSLQQLGIEVLDLRPILSGAPPSDFCLFDYHLSETGHQRVANALSAWIRKRQIL